MSPEMNPNGKLTIHASRELRASIEPRTEGFGLNNRSGGVIFEETPFGTEENFLSKIGRQESDWLRGISGESALSRMGRAESDWLRGSTAPSGEIE